MIGDSGTSHTGATHRYYKCNHRKRQRVCDMGAVRKDPIEELVVKTTVERVLTPENIDRIAQSAVEIAAKEAAESEVLAALKQKHKEVSKRIANLMEAIEQGIITSTTKERLEILEQEQRDLDLQIIKEEMDRPTLTVERVKYWLESFRFGNIDSLDYKRKIIDTLVNSVFVYENDGGGKRIVITYNISGSKADVLLSSDIEAIAPVFYGIRVSDSIFCCR